MISLMIFNVAKQLRRLLATSMRVRKCARYHLVSSIVDMEEDDTSVATSIREAEGSYSVCDLYRDRSTVYRRYKCKNF